MASEANNVTFNIREREERIVKYHARNPSVTQPESKARFLKNTRNNS